MLYALLCYGCEDEIAAMTARDERAMVDRCIAAARALPIEIRHGPALRLMPTSTSITLRGREPFALDGPYTQTREQLLGLWVFDCESLDDAMEAGRRIAEARGITGGAMEVRPIARFHASGRAELTLT